MTELTDSKGMGRPFVLEQVEGHWQKLFAALLWKLKGKEGAVLHANDFKTMSDELAAQGLFLLTWGHADSFEFRFVTEAEGERLTRHVEGLGGHAEKPS